MTFECKFTSCDASPSSDRKFIKVAENFPKTFDGNFIATKTTSYHLNIHYVGISILTATFAQNFHQHYNVK